MSLQKLIESIQHDAQEEADKIVAHAEAEAARILDAARVVTNADVKRQTEVEVARCRSVGSQSISQARLAARNRLLDIEQEQIDLVMDEVLNRLDSLEDETYLEWMKQAILDVVRSGDDRVVVRSQDRERLSDAWRLELEEALQERQGLESIEIEYTDEAIGGGFILRHPSYDIDMTYLEVVKSLWNERRADIAQMLFRD
jgi:V/A-type H+/Na+-transporting ATPase subunit E